MSQNNRVSLLLRKTRERLRAHREGAYLRHFSDNEGQYRAYAESLLAEAEADTDALVDRLRAGLSSLIR